MPILSHEPPRKQHESARPHPIHHWRPGQPLPKDFDPDPWAALARNAEAHAAQNAPLPFRARNRRPADVAADRRVA